MLIESLYSGDIKDRQTSNALVQDTLFVSIFYRWVPVSAHHTVSGFKNLENKNTHMSVMKTAYDI